MRLSLLGIVLTVTCASALADETYTFHESLKPGDKIACEVSSDDHEKTTTTTKDQPPDKQDLVTRQSLKYEETIIAAKDGSATRLNCKVSAGSDSTKTADMPETVTPSPYVGQDVILQRHPDEAVTDDFNGKADPMDSDLLRSVLNPDQDFFPDKPVAVGDTWDVTDKVKKHSDFEKGDKVKIICRLDWVKSVEGKRMAQIVATQDSESRSADQQVTKSHMESILLVDVAAGMIVKIDMTQQSTYSAPDAPVQMTGSGEVTFHGTAVKLEGDAAKP